MVTCVASDCLNMFLLCCVQADVSYGYFSANKKIDLEVKCDFVSCVCASVFAVTVIDWHHGPLPVYIFAPAQTGTVPALNASPLFRLSFQCR